MLFAEVNCQTCAWPALLKFEMFTLASAALLRFLLTIITVNAPSLERTAAKTTSDPDQVRLVGNTRIAKRRLVAIVIAIHLHRFVGRRRSIGSGPTRRHVQTFATEDAEDVRLCCCAVDESFRSPVVFSDSDLQTGIVSIHPVAEARNELHFVVDPTRVECSSDPKVIVSIDCAGSTCWQRHHC